MKRKIFLVVTFLLVVLIAACAPTTPTPPTPPSTGGVTPPLPLAATAVPTANFRATEASIISHVFATLTATAPTRVPPPAVSPTPTRRPTTAPVVKATTRPASPVAPSLPAPPGPTADPYLPQIPKGKGGVVVANYVGGRDAVFTINIKAYTIPSNGKQLIVLDPGTYNFSAQIVGGGGGWSDAMQIIADQYRMYPITGAPNQ